MSVLQCIESKHFKPSFNQVRHTALAILRISVHRIGHNLQLDLIYA